MQIYSLVVPLTLVCLLDDVQISICMQLTLQQAAGNQKCMILQTQLHPWGSGMERLHEYNPVGLLTVQSYRCLLRSRFDCVHVLPSLGV